MRTGLVGRVKDKVVVSVHHAQRNPHDAAEAGLVNTFTEAAYPVHESHVTVVVAAGGIRIRTGVEPEVVAGRNAIALQQRSDRVVGVATGDVNGRIPPVTPNASVTVLILAKRSVLIVCQHGKGILLHSRGQHLAHHVVTVHAGHTGIDAHQGDECRRHDGKKRKDAEHQDEPTATLTISSAFTRRTPIDSLENR